MFIKKILQFAFKSIFSTIYKIKLPHFADDFDGKRVFMISELPGGESVWEGTRRRRADLGNTHPWNRYFNKPLRTKPQTLADIEAFLQKCLYVSDRKTRSQDDFWEPPDIFEKRKTGDCEDHAIWAWRHLHDLGIRSRLALGDDHAWVHIFRNGRAYLLEATQKYNWFPNRKSYDTHWSIECIGKKKFAFFLHGENSDIKIGKPGIKTIYR